MMYESPIEIISKDINYQRVEEYERQIIKAVQSYDIKVNKEELIKALSYDRQQYEKGYRDAQSERKEGYYIGEGDGYEDGELVYGTWYCSECDCCFEDWDVKPTYNFCPNCGADMRGE